MTASGYWATTAGRTNGLSVRRPLPMPAQPTMDLLVDETTYPWASYPWPFRSRCRPTCPHRFNLLAHTLGGLPMASDPPWPKMHPLEPNWIRRLRRRLRR